MKEQTIEINTIASLYIKICFNDIELATATGFLVRDDKHQYLITNRHVVTGRNNITNECLNENAAIPNNIRVMVPNIIEHGCMWTEYRIELFDADGKKYWLEHPKFKEKVDVIAIRVDELASSTICYGLKSEYKPVVTEQVFIIGYPYGYDINPENGKYAIWSVGTIASEPDLNANICGEQLPAFLIDAKTRQGQSGSPVIYYSINGITRLQNGIGFSSGPVTYTIGIYSGRINKDSDLGYVWKWSLIEEIINQ